MSFLYQEPNTFINIKLTDTGRRLLSLGRLTFDYAVFSDREVNYGFTRRYSNFSNKAGYEITENKVIGPKDAHPKLSLQNFDGTNPISLTSKVFSSSIVVTAQTESIGFWSATTNGTPSTIGSYIIHPDRYISSGSMSSLAVGESLALNGVISGSTLPPNGRLVYFRFKSPIGGNLDPDGSYALPSLFYRVYSAAFPPNQKYLDRITPIYKTGNTKSFWYQYPFNGIDEFYGSASTVNCPVWNLNIVRTSTEIGFPITGSPSIGGGLVYSQSGYTTYASREYNGAKKYFGFDSTVRQVGFIHYSNQYTGNTYAEQLVPGSTEVDMPDLMWHKYTANPGQALYSGWRFTDKNSEIYYDEAAETNYTLLKDGPNSTNMAIGRIYFKLKMIVITDPELLTAMTYKSNRNWTLPPLNVSLVANPKPPLSISNASGLCRSDYVYYVTYLATSTQNSVFMSGSSLGLQNALHCGYIQKVEGYTDENGYSQFLSATFPANSFPYLRKGNEFFTYSGTGWSCNKVQLIVQEVKKSLDPGLDGLNPQNWKLVSINKGNGIYTGETGQNTIDPVYLQSHNFIISREDYNSGTTYYAPSGSLHNMDENNPTLKGLNYGSEDFFFGNIKTKILATTYKSVITVVAADTEYNSTLNSSFNQINDENTYITEIGIFNNSGNLVGIAKPSYPIKKSQSRYLTFQLEFDF